MIEHCPHCKRVVFIKRGHSVKFDERKTHVCPTPTKDLKVTAETTLEMPWKISPK